MTLTYDVKPSRIKRNQKAASMLNNARKLQRSMLKAKQKLVEKGDLNNPRTRRKLKNIEARLKQAQQTLGS